MQDLLGEDFIPKIEDITKEIKNKVKELEPKIKKLRKGKLDSEELSILYNKEGFGPAIFTKLFSKNVGSKLVIQSKFHKRLITSLLRSKLLKTI